MDGWAVESVEVRVGLASVVMGQYGVRHRTRPPTTQARPEVNTRLDDLSLAIPL